MSVRNPREPSVKNPLQLRSGLMVLGLTLCGMLPLSAAAGTPASPNQSPNVRAESDRAEIVAVTQQWIDAFNRKDAAAIVNLYAPDAVFFGTSSAELRDTRARVEAYFASLSSLGDAVITLGAHRVQRHGALAINSGYYTRSAAQNGQLVQNPARFSFVYEKRNGQWLIINHHSSATPVPAPAPSQSPAAAMAQPPSAVAAAQLAPQPILPENLQWNTPAAVPSIRSAWVLGSESQATPYAMRVVLKSGGRIAPHTHPDTRYSTVLSGTLMVGFGQTMDESKLVAVPAGAVYVAPAGQVHWLWARDGEVAYQEAGNGPTGTQMVDSKP